MDKFFRNQKGMNIVGQGGKIMLFTLPSLIAAISLHAFFPRIAALPEMFRPVLPFGFVLLFAGFVLWSTAVIQLVTDFPKGKLVTTGAYGIVRNPIYASVAFFLLPAVSLLTGTWVYLIVSIFLYIGVMMFIGSEEQELTKVFGKEYMTYKSRINRLIPLKKPSHSD